MKNSRENKRPAKHDFRGGTRGKYYQGYAQGSLKIVNAMDGRSTITNLQTSMSKHDKIANNLAKKFGTRYKTRKGIDLVTRNRVIEVETTRSGISQGIRQVEKSDKARYLAVNDANLEAAKKATEGTGIGVMNEHGKIIKRASRCK
jgi:hypothetical protein